MSKTDQLTPRIYVACLASYNRGTLHGRWIDADQDFEDIRDEVALMLRQSPVEDASEWAIHDHEGFAPLSLSEHENLEDVCAAAKLISEYRDAAALMLDNLGGAQYHEEAEHALQDKYAGDWESVDAWIEGLLDEHLFGQVPAFLRPYIDAGQLAADLQLGGDISVLVSGGRSHIFWN